MFEHLLALARILVAALLLGLGVFLTRAGMRVAKALWAGLVTVFGGSTGLLLLSFALASLYEPFLIPIIVRTLFSLVLELVVLLPLSVFQENSFVSGADRDGWSTFALLVYGLLQSSSYRLLNAFRSLDGLMQLHMLTDLLVISVLAVFLGKALSVVPAGNGAPPKTWLRTWYGALSNEARQQLKLATVMLFGAFLSLAAIVTIPFLEQPPTASTFTDKALESDLAGRSLPTEFVDWKPAENPLAALSAQLKSISVPATTSADAGTDTPDSGIPKTTLDHLTATLQKQQEYRQTLLASWAALAQRAKDSRARAEQSARSSFRIDSGNRPGAQETRQHYQALVGWYQSRLDDWSNRLRLCREKVERLDAQWKTWETNLTQALASQNIDRITHFVIPQEHLEAGQYTPDDMRCGESILPGMNTGYGEDLYDRVPVRQNLGDTLGPIGVVARWLLRTESMPLTLIVGMIGFGIFGSAISRIVRNRGIPDAQALTNLGVLIINGASAAVVVFLGVQGGLAAFMIQTEKPNPNPYTLLLTCFIAAIFSEHVWDWARERVRTQFGGGAGAAKPAPPAAPVGAPPAQPPPQPPPPL